MVHPPAMGGSSQGSMDSSTAQPAPDPNNHLQSSKKTSSSGNQPPSSNRVLESNLAISAADDFDSPATPERDTRSRRRLSPLMEFASLLLLHLQAMLFVGYSAVADAWPVLEAASGFIKPLGSFFELAVLMVAPFFVLRICRLYLLKRLESARPARVMRRAYTESVMVPSTMLAVVYFALMASYYTAWSHEVLAAAKLPLLFVLLLVSLALWVLLRHEMVMLYLDFKHPELRPVKNRRVKTYRIYNAGSGGHTAELLHMLTQSPPSANTHLIWVITEGDEQSRQKILEWQAQRKRDAGEGEGEGEEDGGFSMTVVRRARKVHQSWLTVPVTALLSAYDFYRVITASYPYWKQTAATAGRVYPQAVVTNGPGTGFVMAAVVWALKIFGLLPVRSCQVLFVESFARIRTLSLTGKLFYYTGLAARFVVQHAAVAKAYGLELISGLGLAADGPEDPADDPFADFDA